ncbi:uncharacterized protein N0V89_012367 [Didymosphaeria variabile]|uniref:HCNGP-domain-containing protein n=1 Tax=Didymosphaeria variabile TaxID=1932322 RepID=A0A9W9C4D9_9PLEO|nr:uncharacterized protein N0V89_012367 [Didymosphaeria variabile]KAJ4344623.1 hypothetical protein N0V89_012367 [Didymosphaeria variabile]
MLGIDYISSDEEDIAPSVNAELSKPSLSAAASISKATPAPAAVPVEADPTPQSLPEGPSQGLFFSASAIPEAVEEESANNAPPGSPYSSNRLMIQNLTLPPVPNLNIPPSPPGSPPRRSTQKFAQFLELKRKGQHFNQRLESSSVVRDPNHSSKLMDFATITDEDQYTSTLPEGLGVSVVWPEWAYSDALNASQKNITKAKESERSKTPRGPVDFVPARRGNSSGTCTPAGKGSRQNAAGRIVVGSESRPKEKR